MGESSGHGVRLLKLRKGKVLDSDQSIETIIKSYGSNFIIQERVIQHPVYAALHPESINTIRLMTYRVEGEIKCAPAIMRIGVGDTHLDNAHAGGIYIGVSDEGVLFGKAMRNYCDYYFEHPDSHIRFEGYRLPQFEKILEAGKMLHACLPSIGIVNWDFSMNDKNQVVLIESNMGCGGIWLFQNTWGTGAFREDTDRMIDLIK